MKKNQNVKSPASFLYKLIFILAFTAPLVTSCATHPSYTIQRENELFNESLYIPDVFEWKNVREGFERFDFENKKFPVTYHAVKIDLTKADLEITCFPEESSKTGKIFKGTTTKKFARQKNCTVAVNASPFAGKDGQWNLTAKLGSWRQIVGIHIANGIKISEPVFDYAAITFTKTDSQWQAKIINNQNEKDLENCDFAFGGFYTVLENGNFVDFQTVRHDSRTGFGLSEDGKTLFILCVEGEIFSKSEGLSYPQCARIFKAMGCSDALEMDGGGSTQLCINGKSVLSYPVVRVQGNSIGFR